MTTTTAEAGAWAPWAGARADLAGLARYVVPTYTPAELQLGLEQAARSAGERAAALYEALARTKLPYQEPAWSSTGKQWVRDPRWFLEQSGTCVDAAVVYSGALLRAGIAPVVVIVEHRRMNHALVAVDLTRDPTTGRLSTMFDGQFEAATSEADLDAVRVLLGGETAIFLDVVRALQGPNHGSWNEATDAGWIDGLLDGARRVHLVDPVWLHRRGGIEPVTPLDGVERPRPAVTQRLPEVVGGLDRELAVGDAPVSVFYGPQGVGKSFAALGHAGSFEQPFGWVLTATDEDTLLWSLAAAQYAETSGDPTTAGNKGEINAFAQEAQARLTRPFPWTVIVDNANAAPAEIAKELPVPRTALGQRLIITTTNPRWRDWAIDVGAVFVEVGRLDDETVTGYFGVPAKHTDRIDGRVLFAASYAAMERNGIELDPAAAVPEGVDPAAATLWHGLVTSQPNPEGVIEALGKAAWLQPDQIPVSVLGEDAEAAARLGLLRDDTGTVAIHRLVAAAIRSHASPVSALADPRFTQDLRNRAEADELNRLSSAILDARGHSDPSEWSLAAEALITIFEARGKAATDTLEKTCEALEEALRDRGAVDGTDAQKRALSLALIARARYRNQEQQPSDEQLAEGIRFAEEAEVIRKRIDNGAELVLSAQAMRWLLEAKRRIPDPVAKDASLAEALGHLETITGHRQELLGDHGDTARSWFNLGRLNVNLAQSRPEHAEAYLVAARKAYREAQRIREAVYRPVPRPFSASAENGLALCDYFSATLQRAHSNGEAYAAELVSTIEARSAQLRAAETHNRTAHDMRLELAQQDDVEVMKSVELGHKIATARLALHHLSKAGNQPEMATRADAAHRLHAQIATVEEELASFGVAGPMFCDFPGQFGDGTSGFRATITTRFNGVSSHRYRSLNLGDHVDDDHDAVVENRRRVCQALGIDALTVANQIHENHVAVIDDELAGAGHSGDDDARARLGGIDAMITNRVGPALTILVADCIPLVFWHQRTRSLGVAHAGRGGVVSNVIATTVERLCDAYGASPSELVVGVGPYISLESYEVGRTELDEYRELFPGARSLGPSNQGLGAGRIDLGAAARTRLIDAGVAPGAITEFRGDTYTDPRLFSNRKAFHDAGNTVVPCGRFALIAWIADA